MEHKNELEAQVDATTQSSTYNLSQASYSAFMAKVTDIDSESSSSASAECDMCCVLDEKIVKLKTHNRDLINELTNLKDAYDILSKSEKEFKETIKQYQDDAHDFKVTIVKKQDAINLYLDEINELKCELAQVKLDSEAVSRKLESYLNYAYILDHIVTKEPAKRKGIRYHKVPPPVR